VASLKNAELAAAFIEFGHEVCNEQLTSTMSKQLDSN
jgi:hypothetical protein